MSRVHREDIERVSRQKADHQQLQGQPKSVVVFWLVAFLCTPGKNALAASGRHTQSRAPRPNMNPYNRKKSAGEMKQANHLVLWFTELEAADADDAPGKSLIRAVPECVAHELHEALRQRLLLPLGIAAPLREREQKEKRKAQPSTVNGTH